MKRFMQKFEKSNGKAKNAQSFYQKYLKIARYSFDIFRSNFAHFGPSENHVLNRTKVNEVWKIVRYFCGFSSPL